MDLIDDHEPQIPEQPGNGHVFVEQQGFQGFRGNLEDPGRMLHHFGLVGLGNVPMPVPHRDAPFFTERLEPEELVIDQGLERTDVDAPHAFGRILGKQGQDGNEGRSVFPEAWKQ